MSKETQTNEVPSDQKSNHVTRRGFLERLKSGTYTAVSMLIAFPAVKGWFSHAEEMKGNEEKQEKQAAQPNIANNVAALSVAGIDLLPVLLDLKTLVQKRTDQRHQLPDGTELRNLGVIHTLGTFRKNRESYEQIVQEADVIFLEDFDKYGKEWEALAQKYGKTVVRIEKVSEDKALLAVMAQFSSIGLHSLNLAKSQELRTIATAGSWLRRAVCAVMMGTQLSKEAISPLIDLSFVVDARTVKMLENALVQANQWKGKKIVIVSGDSHAKGIEYYLQHPKVFET